MKRLALISVSDKSGIAPFVKELVDRHNYTILSTGGTAKLLEEQGIATTEVSKYTEFPEMMEGRVKTLHPKIHGGLLARRDKEGHMEAAQKHAIEMIDLVVVNLYPFESTIAKPDTDYETAIENIDIGGPSMLRSAAKNHASVSVIVDADDYLVYLDALNNKDSDVLLKLRKQLALKVFKKTASYDKAISEYLAKQSVASNEIFNMSSISDIPDTYELSIKQSKVLRYGENPHQKAALYGDFFNCFEQLQGKELSFNNIIDITAATYLIGEFQKPTVAILKHTNPCGVASDVDLVTAWEKAFSTDRQAPFGGIIVVNQTVDKTFALKVSSIFFEVIIAPAFTNEARLIFAKKKNIRLMVAKGHLPSNSLREVRSVVGGLLLQDRDMTSTKPSDWKVVTKRQPTEIEMRSMVFGWKVVKHLKSNAIVYTSDEKTLGVGAGQMSRVDSSKIAVWKASEANLSLMGSAICSDAFFPFPDGLIAAAEAGAKAVIQPGGSMRDAEVIEEANTRNLAMIFTGRRHFKH